MARLSVEERLAVAIQEAATEADRGTTSRQIAEDFYSAESNLVEPFVRSWTIETLARMIRGHRVKATRAANPQLVFEGMLGFKGHLPPRIETKDGKKIDRGDATIGILRVLASQLGQKETPALQEVHRAIALMSPYTPDNQRITWREVIELEAKKK